MFEVLYILNLTGHHNVRLSVMRQWLYDIYLYREYSLHVICGDMQRYTEITFQDKQLWTT